MILNDLEMVQRFNLSHVIHIYIYTYACLLQVRDLPPPPPPRDPFPPAMPEVAQPIPPPPQQARPHAMEVEDTCSSQYASCEARQGAYDVGAACTDLSFFSPDSI